MAAAPGHWHRGSGCPTLCPRLAAVGHPPVPPAALPGHPTLPGLNRPQGQEAEPCAFKGAAPATPELVSKPPKRLRLPHLLPEGPSRLQLPQWHLPPWPLPSPSPFPACFPCRLPLPPDSLLAPKPLSQDQLLEEPKPRRVSTGCVRTHLFCPVSQGLMVGKVGWRERGNRRQKGRDGKWPRSGGRRWCRPGGLPGGGNRRLCGDWRSRAEENRGLSLPVLSWSSSHRLRAKERLGDPGDPRPFLPILPALHGLRLVKVHGVWGLGQTPALVSHWPALCPPQVRSPL